MHPDPQQPSAPAPPPTLAISTDVEDLIAVDAETVIAVLLRVEDVTERVADFVTDLGIIHPGRPRVLSRDDLSLPARQPEHAVELLQRGSGLPTTLAEDIISSVHHARELADLLRESIDDVEARRSQSLDDLGPETHFAVLDAAVIALFDDYADVREALLELERVMALVPRAPDKV